MRPASILLALILVAAPAAARAQAPSAASPSATSLTCSNGMTLIYHVGKRTYAPGSSQFGQAWTAFSTGGQVRGQFRCAFPSIAPVGVGAPMTNGITSGSKGTPPPH